MKPKFMGAWFLIHNLNYINLIISFSSDKTEIIYIELLTENKFFYIDVSCYVIFFKLIGLLPKKSSEIP